MITEVIRYKILAENAEAFEEAENWILLLHWDSVEGHEQGFRREPAFHDFLKLVMPFSKQTLEMKHYERTKMQWKRAS
jgi:hypothetical protein